MKKLFIICCVLLSLAACGTGGGSGDGSTGVTLLALDQVASDTIATEGEVDWFEYTAVEVGRTLNIECVGTYHDSPVAFVVTAYDVDDAGNLTPIIGRSASENVYALADLKLKIGIHGRRRLRIAVRDLGDDNYSDSIPYRLRVYYSESASVADNSSFAQAVTVGVGAQQCASDTIAQRNEVNCYTFAIQTAGVYRVSAAFGVPITKAAFNLGLELFDASGNLIHAFDGPRPTNDQYDILAYLDAGGYYLVAYDQGKNEFFDGQYSVCVVPVAAAEANVNDTVASATAPLPDASDTYTLDGSLEYIQDQDWYRIDIPADDSLYSYNLRIAFQRDFDNDTVPDSINQLTVMPEYRVTVRDANGNVINQFDRSADTQGTYTIELGRRPGTAHYITVTPNFRYMLTDALPYQLRATLLQVSDAGESLEGALTPPTELTGKIFKIGDTDTYTVDVDTSGGPKVLEIFFETGEASDVDYVIHINDGAQKVLRDRYGNAATRTEGVKLKTSYYYASDTTVTLQVADDQNNSGSQVEYTLRVNVLDVPSVLPAIDATTQGVVGASPTFFSEPEERNAVIDTAARSVAVVEYMNENQPEFKANTTYLRVGALDAGNQWQSPWMGGLVDYDGDRDIFELNFDDVAKSDDWYFDIQVHMYAPASGVEFSWTLFRDGPTPNDLLLERTFWSDTTAAIYDYEYSREGVVAAWADDTLSSDIINVLVPDPGTDFWIGDGWSSSRFYLSIQDFNRTGLSTTLTESGTVQERNPDPDNDWSNTSPYFFRVTVTLHDGESTP